MNRDDLKILAERRIEDADALLAAGRWQAAYYLLGYAVECGLKACAARQFHEAEVPGKQVVLDFYTHKWHELLGISGVKIQLQAQCDADLAFETNWRTFQEWDVAVRYDHTISETKARNMFAAVADPASGVLTWLKKVW